MKNISALVFATLIFSVLFYYNTTYASNIIIKCQLNEDRLDKTYFDRVRKSLVYIKLSTKNKFFFGWNSNEKKFERNSSLKITESYYLISKNLKSGISNDGRILGLNRGIKISRETGSLWMGPRNDKRDPEDMNCTKILENELPRINIKTIF